MSALTQWMDRTWYPDYEEGWDQKKFRAYLKKFLRPDAVVLDYGAGRGALPEFDLRDEVAWVAGIDPSEAVLKNPFLNEAKVLRLPDQTIPYESEKFDVVFSANVMEHIQDPETCLKEIWRVLKPGGVFVCKTPNKWHYVPIIATLTPYSFHQRFNQSRGIEEDDIFPTVYRCNTPGAIKSFAAQVGFELAEMEMWEGRPGYLRFMAPFYFLGFLFERFVNSSPLFANLRVVIVFTLRKPRN